ncbi:MAG: T9SS type A sorting domain-containing protein [Candidatus Marinimicrobia bacterium]|jgi:hypothetical protein|nr:T9SS type A sorting domain-containing protein [Candidatus Neomarinimicrobiota bacterium]MBT4946430.1 T9SS type A sorting domain-containing protein [Candidatus Neomarinimicrobiota bacterium]MBT5271125.1 T9SS type A sorting domain-containing protein [Candidatus Neomarinimicrobiota bacterium]
MKRLWLLVILMLAGSCGLFGQNGLIAYYPFNSNTNDESGNGNDGDTTGHAPFFILDRFENENRAFSFNGVDAYVDIPNETQLRLFDPYSISIWVYVVEDNDQGALLIGKSASHQGHRNYAIEFLAGRLVSFLFHQNEYTAISLTHDIPLLIGEWHHILAIHDNTEIKLYINNYLVQSQTVSSSDVVTSYLDSPQNLAIGRHTYGSSDGYFNGLLDDVHIYDRAITPLEIDSLYHVDDWDVEHEDGLITYYPFNGNIADESGNGYNGTIQGVVLTEDRFGNSNKAGDFDGSSYINTNVGSGESYTSLSSNVWIKSKQDISGFGQGYTTVNFISIFGPESGVFRIGANGSVGDSGVSFFEMHNGIFYTNPLDDNEWHMLTLTYGDSVWQSYIDGELIFSDFDSGPIESNNNFCIGARHDYGVHDEIVESYIDDVSVYSYVLSNSEIDSLYHEGGWDVDHEDDLVAYYPFNGNANDESGYGNDGDTIGHTPTPTHDRFGNENSAYHFNGINNYIQIPHTPVLDSMNQITVSLWIKPESEAPYSFPHHIIEKYGSWNFGQRHRDVRWEVTSFDSYTDHWVIDLELDTYYHIVMTFDDIEMRIYVNNILETAIEATGSMTPSITDIYIGQYTFGGDYYYNGVIDDIRIYNTALSASEVDVLYHFDGWEREDSAVEVIDATGNYNSIILVPVQVFLEADNLYRAAELDFSSYVDGLEFMGIDTIGTMIGGLDWTWADNEVDNLLHTVFAGSDEISGTGVFCYLEFLITGDACNTVPVNCNYALFNDVEIIDITNGLVSIDPVPEYGDVDENGYIQALDASDILIYILNDSYLDCQGLANADTYLDGVVDPMDVTMILRYLVELEDALPVTPSEGFLAAAELTIEDQNAEPGSHVQIPLNIANGQNIYSFEGSITYDPTILIPDGDIVSWSPLLDDFIISTAIEEGLIRFVGASSSPDGEAGTFATLNFTMNGDFEVGNQTEVFLESMKFNSNLVIEDVSTIVSSIVSVDPVSIPTEYVLKQNYPNPFNPSTTLRYGLPEDATVSFVIYDIRGEVVKTIDSGTQIAGWYEHVWNGLDESGQSVSTGLYLTRLQAGSYTKVIKMLYLK